MKLKFVHDTKTGDILHYLISDTGVVFSTDYRHTGDIVILKQFKDKDGHLRVPIFDSFGKKHSMFVHRLMAYEFLDVPEYLKNKGFTKDNLIVNHLNGIPWDNRIENLEFTTVQGNTIHAYKTGLAHGKSGELNSMSKYTETDIHNVCKLLETGKYTIKEISNLTNVSVKAIYALNDGVNNTWNNIVSLYNIPKRSGYIRNNYLTDDIDKICKLLDSNMYTMPQIAKMTNVPLSTIHSIKYGLMGKTISINYNFMNKNHK